MTEQLNEAPQRAVDVEYSYTTVTFKQQGNGENSWVVNYFNEKDERIFSEIVFKDPTKPDTEQAQKVVDTLTPEMAVKLFELLIENIDQVQQSYIDKLKEILK